MERSSSSSSRRPTSPRAKHLMAGPPRDSKSDDRWLAGDAYEAYMGRWSRALAPAFLDWLHAPSDARWLEVGCGTGALTASILGTREPRSIVACDPSDVFIAHARETLTDPRVSFVTGGADV